MIMPHISARKLKKEVFQEINKRLIDSFADIKDKRLLKSFVDELLTSTEKIMLAKRLAVIFMLSEKFSFYRIQKSLKISTQTAMRMYGSFKSGKFNNITKVLNKEKDKRNFWLNLEILLRAGMPPMGRGRWRWFYEIPAKYDRGNRHR